MKKVLQVILDMALLAILVMWTWWLIAAPILWWLEVLKYWSS